MTNCPACGAETPEGSRECPACHLSTSLFDALRDVTGPNEGNPKYIAAVVDILKAADAVPPADPPKAPSPVGATPAHPARFPSAAPAAPSSEPTRAPGPQPPTELPAFRALPPGAHLPVLRKQVEELMLLARRQGLEVAVFDERARAAVAAKDAKSFELLSRDIYVHLAAALTGQYESMLVKRNEIRGLLPTDACDVELEAARSSLRAGDLGGAQRRLRVVGEQLDALEVHWTTARILLTEADLLSETIRELGSDPAPELAVVEEGRMAARAGDSTRAEDSLVRATAALWQQLSPLFATALHGIRDEILARRSRGDDMSTCIDALRELTVELRRRNYGATVLAYRKIRTALHPTPGNLPAAKGVIS